MCGMLSTTKHSSHLHPRVHQSTRVSTVWKHVKLWGACGRDFPGGWQEARRKLVVLQGDITLPNLGLDRRSLARVQAEVEHVIHAAADIGFDREVSHSVAHNYKVGFWSLICHLADVWPLISSVADCCSLPSYVADVWPLISHVADRWSLIYHVADRWSLISLVAYSISCSVIILQRHDLALQPLRSRHVSAGIRVSC